MNQIRYILFPFLFLVIVGIAFWFLKRLNTKKEIRNSTALKAYHSDSVILSDSSFMAGKILFINKCAACHSIGGKVLGPTLADLEKRGPWSDRSKLYKYIRDPLSMRNDEYVKKLWSQSNVRHIPFPDLSDSLLNSIISYIAEESKRISGPIP
jgi:cytochrome c2